MCVCRPAVKWRLLLGANDTRRTSSRQDESTSNLVGRPERIDWNYPKLCGFSDARSERGVASRNVMAATKTYEESRECRSKTAQLPLPGPR